MTQPIPEGFHAVTPSLTFKDTQKALEFYKKAFNAKVLDSFPGPDGKGTMHAVIQIGDSILMAGDASPTCKSPEDLGGSPINLCLYVKDADAAFKQAISAGCTETMPVDDMFWGDRSGNLTDPFGYPWMIATHTRDLGKEEIQKGAKEFFARMAKK